MSHFGPTRAELKFRLVFSLIGLAGMIFALVYRGVSGIAAFEIIGIAGAFFGGSAVWSAWQLWKSR